MTDALVALSVFGALMMILPPIGFAALGWVFSPRAALTLLQGAPAVVAASPLVSQLAAASLFGAIFNAILLLVSGRHVEKAIGAVGLVLLFVAGAYAGAVARLVLTPGSAIPGFGANGGLFAVIGAYLMLYGIPRGLPLNLRGTRVVQIAGLALIWIVLQLLFMLASAGADLSVAIVEPLGGLAAGVALARPLLTWRYRKA